MIRAGVWCCGRDVVTVRYVGRIALMRGEGWGRKEAQRRCRILTAVKTFQSSEDRYLIYLVSNFILAV